MRTTSREVRTGPLILWLSASHSYQESDADTKLHTMHLRERKIITFTMVQEQFFKLLSGRHREEQYLNSRCLNLGWWRAPTSSQFDHSLFSFFSLFPAVYLTYLTICVSAVGIVLPVNSVWKPDIQLQAGSAGICSVTL